MGRYRKCIKDPSFSLIDGRTPGLPETIQEGRKLFSSPLSFLTVFFSLDMSSKTTSDPDDFDCCSIQHSINVIQVPQFISSGIPRWRYQRCAFLNSAPNNKKGKREGRDNRRQRLDRVISNTSEYTEVKHWNSYTMGIEACGYLMYRAVWRWQKPSSISKAAAGANPRYGNDWLTERLHRHNTFTKRRGRDRRGTQHTTTITDEPKRKKAEKLKIKNR